MLYSISKYCRIFYIQHQSALAKLNKMFLSLIDTENMNLNNKVPEDLCEFFFRPKIVNFSATRKSLKTKLTPLNS